MDRTPEEFAKTVPEGYRIIQRILQKRCRMCGKSHMFWSSRFGDGGHLVPTNRLMPLPQRLVRRSTTRQSLRSSPRYGGIPIVFHDGRFCQPIADIGTAGNATGPGTELDLSTALTASAVLAALIAPSNRRFYIPSRP